MAKERPVRLPSRTLRISVPGRDRLASSERREGWTLVLFALPEEARPFGNRVQSLPASSRVTYACSGAGRSHAEQAADDYAGVAAPGDILLICGFAGGLVSDLAPGSLIVADRVIDTRTEESIFADSTLLEAAESVALSDLPLHRGALVTGDRVLVAAGEKRRFAEQTGGIAVDMETAAAARVAQKAGIPWLAIRAITDGVEDDLPLDFNTLADPSGNVHRGRIILSTLLHPWKIPALIRLGKRSALAAENLAVFLDALLRHLPEPKP